MGFLRQLRERNVFKIGAIYVVVAWVLAQVASTFLPNLNAPDWVLSVFLFFLLLGFPVALIMAWALELTPEGIKRAETSVGEKRMWTISIVLALAAVAWFQFGGSRDIETQPVVVDTSTEPDAKTIAVLPFVDLSPTQDQEWFTDGLTEEVLNSLARAPDLLVSSRTSSFAYKNSNKPLTLIATELGVAHVLEGSVRRVGEHIRVTAQLIRARDGFHLWSENIDGDAEDVIEIQERVATEIAQALETAMDPEALAKMMQAGTRSVRAYELYLKARSSENIPHEHSETGSHFLDYELPLLNSAVEEDPGFAAAHAEIAAGWRFSLELTRTGSQYFTSPAEERRECFNAAISKAIEHAENDIDRLHYEYQRAWVAQNWRLGLEKIKAYSDARPMDTVGCASLGEAAVLVSDPDMGRVAVERCIKAGQVDDVALMQAVVTAYRLDLPATARELYNEHRDRVMSSLTLSYQFNRALLWESEVELAAELLPALRSSDAIFRRMPLLRQACAEGDREAAEQMLDELVALPKDEASRTERWLAYSLLGYHDEARALLRELENEGKGDLIAGWLHFPQFDPHPFEDVMNLLARNRIERPPVRLEPFACPAAGNAT